MRRRRARELALTLLYQADIRNIEIRAVLESGFWNMCPEPREDIRSYAETLAVGTERMRARIDGMIRKFAHNWKLERMGYIDRNILRMATFEMLVLTEVPPVVSINEAIEIAKMFGTEDSSKFVNGILNRIKEELPGEKPDSAPAVRQETGFSGTPPKP